MELDFLRHDRDFRPWYEKGKVLCIARKTSDGIGYRYPVRPWRDDYWDNFVVRGLMSSGETVVIVDYGYYYNIPEFYNDIPSVGSQLELF